MLADRVKETSTTTGTGTLNLAGASTGYQTFVAGIGNGKKCYYCIADATDWEVGIGTVTDAATDTLSRDRVLYSSNANALVNFAAGSKEVFVTAAANDLEIANSNLAPTQNIIVPAGNGAIVPDTFEIIDSYNLEIEDGAIFEIT